MLSLDDHQRRWAFADTEWVMGDFPKLMGIVNVTPDSFSDGGSWLDPARAVEHALQLVDDGASVVDIGGESTRPDAVPVSAEEEQLRVVPVIQELAKQTKAPISIDTMKASVARAALDAGATIVNDVSGLEADAEMVNVVAANDCGVIAMHMLGTPQTMQANPQYDDCVNEITNYLEGRVEALVDAGVKPERIMLDPGVGFGKTAQHNVEILTSIDAFRLSGRPVLIGHSRKRFLSKVIGRPVEERLAGTIGVAIALATQHTDLIRVHDVAAVNDALIAWKKTSPE